jgi:hypothetical protein
MTIVIISVYGRFHNNNKLLACIRRGASTRRQEDGPWCVMRRAAAAAVAVAQSVSQPYPPWDGVKASNVVGNPVTLHHQILLLNPREEEIGSPHTNKN